VDYIKLPSHIINYAKGMHIVHIVFLEAYVHSK